MSGSTASGGTPRPASASVVIVGAGPAGLFAADRLSERGCSVSILERMPSPARKLMMAGRGGLNLTHSEPLQKLLARYGDADPRLLAAVTSFPPEALIAWINGLGIETFVGSSGRVFPRAMKASPLVRSLLRRLASRGVTIRLSHRFAGWDASGGLRIESPSGVLHEARPDALLLALGGASWPRLGADGRWSNLLQDHGVAVAPLTASNAGLLIDWSPAFRARFEGRPLKRIAISIAGTTCRGEAIITRTGLEGGAVYALGPAVRRELTKSATVGVSIDLRPDLDTSTLALRLAHPRAKQSIATFLRKRAGLAPEAIGLVREARGGALADDPQALAQAIKSARLTSHGLAGLERAISTAGGVRFEAVDEHAMLTALPGVFVAGEMLDWDAPTGGYLLQATFATACWAANGILAWLTRHGSVSPPGPSAAAARDIPD